MKTKYRTTFSTCLLAFSATFMLLISNSDAAVIITTSSASTPFTVSNSDLLQTDLSGAPVVIGNFTQFSTGGETVLRDGSNGGIPDTNFSTTAIIDGGSSVTYALDTVSNPLGYNLTEIVTFGAWDEGRDAQNINVLYSVVGAPSTFLALATIGFDPPFPNNFSRVSLTPGVGEQFVATGVHSIRFAFPSQENGGGGYRELDVIGFAVPEPTTPMLFGISALAVAFTRRRFLTR
jgi:hypothetical protein